MGTRCSGEPGDRQIPLYLSPPSQPSPSPQPEKSYLRTCLLVISTSTPCQITYSAALRGPYVALRRPLVVLRWSFVDMRGPFADMGRLFGLRRPFVGLGDPCVSAMSLAGPRSHLT